MDRYIEFVTNHWLLFIALAVVTFLLIQDLLETVLRKFDTLSPLMVVSKMNNEDPVILDIRDAIDFKNGHIDTAMNLPLDKFDDKMDKLKKHSNDPVIVVCQTGTRSTTACKKLTDSGLNKVFCMVGGMQSWEENNFPIKKSKQ